MTLETPPPGERGFLRAGLPWVVAGAAFLFYLATLNRGLSFDNLSLVAKVNGWDWRPMISQPLLFLLTLPCRWLPAAAVPLALNLLSAVCAIFTLALLARSVALLPHDRVEEQRQLVQHPRALLSIPAAWVPIVLAVAALALQQSFWEHATAASADMLDLVLFAYVIRCLLEYRNDERPTWLDRAALVYGLAMANGWLPVAFLPLFVVALFWTRPLSFFQMRFFQRIERHGWDAAKPHLAADFRFLLRTALLGLAGLSLILLLPLVQSFSHDFSVGFWPAVRGTASGYKTALFLLARVFLRFQRESALVLASVSLVPVLLLSIRWRAPAPGNSPVRIDLVAVILYLSHVFLLLLCVWVVFDPPFSPRQLGRRMGFPLSFLPLYYLGALSVGYYSGFFLLVFSDYGRSRRLLKRALAGAVPALVCLLLAVTLAGLLFKNLPAIRAAHRPYLAHYAGWIARSLPPEGAVVLADDPLRLAALQAALLGQTNASRYLLAEMPALAVAAYRDHLRRRHPGQWPELDAAPELLAATRAGAATNAPLSTFAHLQLLDRLARHHRIFCLQADFGILPERFQLRPRGLVYELTPYPTNAINGPPLSSAELGGNEAFWQLATETDLRSLLHLVDPPARPRASLESKLMQLGYLEPSTPTAARALALWYSAALNHWGVTLQHNDHVARATSCFALAQQLNPDNLPARVNLQCNSNLLAEVRMPVNRSPAFLEQFGQNRNWRQFLAGNGPFDDPSYCYQIAMACANAGLLRQAVQQIGRVVALAPDDLQARLDLGQLLIRAGLPGGALEIAAGIQAAVGGRALSPRAAVQLDFLQAEAWLAQTNQAKAVTLVDSLLASYPDDAALLSRAAGLFAQYRSYSNALRLADRHLQLAPDDLQALAQKGLLSLVAGDISNAIPPLTRALSLTNSYAVRVNRALAYLRLGDLKAAEADYLALIELSPRGFEGLHGLAEVALQKGDTNAAIRHYERARSSAEPGSDAARAVEARLKSLQTPGR